MRPKYSKICLLDFMTHEMPIEMLDFADIKIKEKNMATMAVEAINFCVWTSNNVPHGLAAGNLTH